MNDGVKIRAVLSKLKPGACFGWFQSGHSQCSVCEVSDGCCREKRERIERQEEKMDSAAAKVIRSRMRGVPRTDGTTRCVVYEAENQTVGTIRIMTDGRVVLKTDKGFASVAGDSVKEANAACDRLL